MPDLTHLALPGATIPVRATPKAARDRIVLTDTDEIRVYVTTVPEGGKATKAIQRLLAKAMGVAPGRLTLIRGAAHRDKLFRLD
ncbi:DUF167 domain-containing protein [Flavimaricola marinus]|uniref:Uncharacterized protein n=1 Tax=Flavimaricola marinus TaxID=1819565 RepID=A0A238LGA5_9RHOB|nr:DUF167 domain-containing protein [Flavimaricola marinus]SMY08648.1 hypothetical protein LOM8899_02803 [Flavimaricola marinus]